VNDSATSDNTALFVGGGALVLFVVLFLAAGLLPAVIGAVIIGAGVYAATEMGGSRDTRRTTLPPSQIIRQAVQEIGTQRRFTATGHSSDFASFTFKQHANCLIAIIFTCFFILPGILYFFISSRTQSLTINVFPEPDGTTSVQVSASGGETKRRGRRFLRALPAATPVVTQGMQQVGAQASHAAPESPAATVAAALPQAHLSASTPAAAAAPPPPAELQPAPPAAPQAQPAPPQEVVYCHDCGAKMAGSHRFCPSCGKEQMVS